MATLKKVVLNAAYLAEYERRRKLALDQQAQEQKSSRRRSSDAGDSYLRRPGLLNLSRIERTW
jgi:hypothetical protein